jgi:hypothetical protein
MGYNTKFRGVFELSKQPSPEAIDRLIELSQTRHDRSEYPSYYCQWVIDDDYRRMKWDGGESFHNYVEWLQWIIDNILKPESVSLTGQVEFTGEDVEDVGVLIVADDQNVQIHKKVLVPDDYDDLKRFRDFVLTSDWRDEILEAWEKRRG